jgi:hypothetical protein
MKTDPRRLNGHERNANHDQAKPGAEQIGI